jgi:Domain of unknown function (DUF4476)
MAQQGATLVVWGTQNEALTLSIDNAVVNTTPHSLVRLEGVTPGPHSIVVSSTPPGGMRRSAAANVNLPAGVETQYVLQALRGAWSLVPAAQGTNATPPIGGSMSFHLGSGGSWVVDDGMGTNMNVQMTPGGFGINIQDGGNGSMTQTTTTQTTTTTTTNLQGYNGPVGCPQPMPDHLYQPLLNQIRNYRQDPTRLAMGKQEISRNCMTADQIRQVVALLGLERDRLDLAKFAYDFCFDCANYFVVMDAFDYNNNAQELEAYVRSRPCGGQVVVNPQVVMQPVQPIEPMIVHQVQPAMPPNPLPGYTGRIGCQLPSMDPGSFSSALNTINSNNFASTQMTIAKQLTGQNCLLASQIQQIMSVFSFESDQLAYAKHAYAFCWDIDNYFQLTNGFDFESSKTDLMNYTSSQNRGMPNPWANPQQQQVIITQPQQQQVVVHPRTGQTQVVVTQPQQQMVVTQQPMMNTGTCTGQPFDGGQWISFVSTVSNNSFANTQKSMIKSTMNGKCITTGQVTQLLEIFSFESDQLELAKYLYDFTMDKQNYFNVSNVFTFESSKTDLMNYIGNRR